MRPEDVDGELVDAGMDGFNNVADMDTTAEEYVRAAIAAVYPLIRAAVIEECAKLADWHAAGHAMSMHAYGSADKDSGRGRQEGHVHAGEAIAVAIRALEDTDHA